MDFGPVPWTAPLDAEAEIAAISAQVTIRGVFVSPLADLVRKAGRAPAWLRPRYFPHENYPLSEHARLLVDVARMSAPQLNLRRALYKLGRLAVGAYLESLVGRVTLGSTDDPEVMLSAIAQGYRLSVRGASARLVRFKQGEAVLQLEQVPYFLDCHHIGLIEQALSRCHVQAQTELAPLGRFSVAYRCTW